MQQAQASLEQGRSNESLARVTKDRFQKSSRQRRHLQARHRYLSICNGQARPANVQALEKAVNALEEQHRRR